MDTYKPFTALPLFLAALVGSVIVWSGINPAFFEVWVAEIIPVALVYLGLVVTHRRFTFSNTAYVMMSMWLLMHSVGAHYTFANVPFEWFNDLVGSDRNHFDRIAHYSIGFYASLLRNTWYAKTTLNLSWLHCSPCFPSCRLRRRMRSLNGGTQY